MSTNLRPSWRLVVVSSLLVLVPSVLVLWLLPEKRGLVWLGLYTIPSNLFISPFPHEPVLLYYPKLYTALECAVASTIGGALAGILDYWLFVPLIHHPKVRSKYTRVTLYQASVKYFRRWPFWTLVVSGALPIPFYPVKFLAMSDHYPLGRYLVALVVGRGPRYYVLAYLGYVMKLPDWSIMSIGAIMLVWTIYMVWKDEKARKSGNKRAVQPADEES